LQSSSQDFDSADSLAETIDSGRVVVNFNLRPSPVREYNTPVAANLHKNEGRRKVSLTEKKKSPRPDKSPSKHTTKVDETEKESHYEWLSFVRKKKPLAEQNKPPRCPSKSRDPKIRSGKSGEAVELIEHRKRIDGEVEKSQTTDPIYCPIKVTHRFVTEIDLWSIWKSCLLARL
uniref:MEL-46 n=1 Tax=Nippostrongylus brasiliensis TaxID=27835 RepID=A0A0N4XRJ1_NIPBR